MNEAPIPRRQRPLPCARWPRCAIAILPRATTRSVVSFKPRLNPTMRWRTLPSFNSCPAPRRRRAAAEYEKTCKGYLLLSSRLQSSWYGPRGCWLQYVGHHDRWFEGEKLREYRSLTSPQSLMSSPPRLRQSSASWFVVEYSSRALHGIAIVLRATSHA